MIQKVCNGFGIRIALQQNIKIVVVSTKVDLFLFYKNYYG